MTSLNECVIWKAGADKTQNPLAVHFGMLKVSDMILVNYEGVPIGGKTSVHSMPLTLYAQTCNQVT